MESEKRECLVCKRELKGRADQKYCSTDCRNKYHNTLNQDVTKFVNNINNILRKNRRILESLNPTGKAKVTRTQLLDEGFKFAYFTNEYVTKGGRAYRFCYEQGYLELEPNLYALVVRKEYVH